MNSPRHKITSFISLLALLINLLPPFSPVKPAQANPLPVEEDRPAMVDSLSARVLPPWFGQDSPGARTGAPVRPEDPHQESGRFLAPAGRDTGLPATVLPGWFTGSTQPPALPPARPQLRQIPLSLLGVEITGPSVASLGSLPTYGEVYTAVIRNRSSDTAYGLYLTATLPSGFSHDNGDALQGPGGPIAFTTVPGPGTLTWTPVTTLNLAPGEVITLNFRLRAGCNAQSAQRLEIGVRYNADPPPASPVELNANGLNITTGRGNLVISKVPALQNLGTPDFGQPITWTVFVQNTGLGRLFNATITDTGGINLAQPAGDLTPIVTVPVIEVNEVQTFTVVGTIEACNFTNVAQASWPCGNQAGDATVTKPVSSTASVLFAPKIPNVSLQVSSPLVFPYCAPVTRTVVVTITNSGGPAGNFRLQTNINGGFLNLVPGSIGGDWTYSGGVFEYTGGSPVGTLPDVSAGVPVTLTFQVRPQDTVCTGGSGDIIFEPRYTDICSNEPFSGSPAGLAYEYAQEAAPTLAINKTGPALVTSGQVFSYVITVSGQNGQSISGTVNVADTVPAEFELVGPPTVSAGSVGGAGQNITWNFDPAATPGAYNEAMTVTVRAITITNGACGASRIVANTAQATAAPTCPGCPNLTANDTVETAIANNEGVFPGQSSSGSLEVCGSGFQLVKTYQVSGSTVITWTGAVFTEALGTAIGDGALTEPPYLIYQPGSLSVSVNGIDYTAVLTPVTTTGQLVIDLSPLDLTSAPTQSLTLALTYTVEISEGANSPVDRTFYDWAQLFLPGVSDAQACAGNNSFNQAVALTIGRGDLSVSLAPQVLKRCSANPVILTVTDNTPGRLTSDTVITFTASPAQILSADNFTFHGSLASISPINVVTNAAAGIITFTLPPGADLAGDGEIHFDVYVDCTDGADWNAGITFRSQCGLPHAAVTSRDHVYLAPNLILFATPVEYTVREKEVIWKFFVTNNGNLTATNVVVTNSLSGLSVTGYTPDSPAGLSLVSSLPVTDPNPFILAIDELGPNQQREITVTAQVAACDPLNVVIRAGYECNGVTCAQPQARVNFNTPDPYLLTNNGQTADLPMCDPGEVVFTTKNASPDVTLYRLNITETLRALTPLPGAPITVTIVNTANVVVASTTEFTPVEVISGSETLLLWPAALAPAAVASYFNALPPLYVVRIQIPVKTSCVPPSTPQSFAQASAQGPCGKELGYTEQAVTLQTLAPDMTVVKEGKVAGGQFGETVYAAPGETVVWRLRVTNNPTDRSYVAHNVVLSDTWPAQFQLTDYTPTFTPLVDGANRTITWTVGDVERDETLDFFITGTVALADDSCATVTRNDTQLTFGCDNGCASSVVPVDSALLDSRPEVEVSLAPDALPTCEGDIRVTVRNYGAAAYSNTLTVTIPSGYVYSETISSGLALDGIITDTTFPQFLWDRIPGRTGPNPYTFDLVLRVQTSGAAGTTCPIATGVPVTATIRYDNHSVCGAPGPWWYTATNNLPVLRPEFVLDKTPATQTVDPASPRVTWTIRLTNTGNGLAENVMVTDTVGSNYVNIFAGPGSDGAPASLVGPIITWTPANIPAGGVWTATVSADLLNNGNNRNVVTATADCATGCQTASANDIAYATLLESFEKLPAVQTGTIGSLVVFTFTTFLWDTDAVYERLTLTDTLPAGLGYVSSVITYTSNEDGGGPTTSTTTPTSAPTPYNSGNVVWQLGDLPGTIQINGIITAVIRDETTNYNGVRLVNNLRMTYTDDGQPYTYNDTADVNVQEPLLHLGKSYVTSSSCNATFLQDNFNRAALGSAWVDNVGTWTINNGRVIPGTGATQRIFSGDPAWTDVSFSAMISSTDTNGDIGLIFRAQAGNANYYRFRWNRGTTNNYILERVVGATITPLGAVTGSLYNTNRWYHVEIRVEGSRFRVYIDGAPVLDRTDAAPPWSSGRVGLYANNQTTVGFDDILVTRLSNEGCYVSANDLVTYTLTISNQGPIPGYDLVITDVIPAGMSLVDSTFQSDDPGAALTSAPVPGATGVLTWGVGSFTPANPFNPLSHRAITLTVVLQVADTITADTVLTNQAFLRYDTQAAPLVGIERTYSGGSHSTAVRTVAATINKAVVFSPLPTATLGTIVTYTLWVPATPLTATLYNVVVTDTLSSFLEPGTVAVSGGVNPTVNLVGQTMTARFDRINHGDQGFITITAVISAGRGATAPQAITNSAVVSHAAALTNSNVVTTDVREPRVSVNKIAAPTGDPRLAVYTVTVTNNGSSPAYSLVITDNLPEGLEIIDIGSGGSLLDSRHISWTIPVLAGPPAPGNTLLLIYTARLSEVIYSSSRFTNTVDVRSTSLTDTIPGVREYITDTVHPFPWPLGRIGDYVWNDRNYDGLQGPGEPGINGVIIELFNSDTGELISTTTTNASGFYIFEYLPLLVTYTVRISTVSYSPGRPLANFTQTLPFVNPANTITDSNASITSTFLGFGYATTTTLTAVITEDLTLDFGFVELVALGNRVWFDTGTGTTNNHIQEAGEAGVANVVVELYRNGQSAGVDTPLLTTTTDITGSYVFDRLAPGDYFVHIPASEFQPGGPLVGYVSTIGNGANETADQNADENGIDNPNLPANGISSTVYSLWANTETTADDETTYTGVLDDDNVNFTADFGFVETVALGNRVWFDTGSGGGTANNGIQEPGETGVANVVVELYRNGQSAGVDTPLS